MREKKPPKILIPAPQVPAASQPISEPERADGAPSLYLGEVTAHATCIPVYHNPVGEGAIKVVLVFLRLQRKQFDGHELQSLITR